MPIMKPIKVIRATNDKIRAKKTDKNNFLNGIFVCLSSIFFNL